jgi:hypothetical protein
MSVKGFGGADALLDRKEGAIGEAKRAVEMLPAAKGAVNRKSEGSPSFSR